MKTMAFLLHLPNGPSGEAMLSSLLFLLLLLRAANQAYSQEFPGFYDDCYNTCCEDDCCGVGTSWLPPLCVGNPSSPGWVAPPDFDPEYCLSRLCCEDACCGEGTIYDGTRCTPQDNVPTLTPTMTQEPTTPSEIEPCKCEKKTKTQVYSRGNNNCPQMEHCNKITGKYMYETARMTFTTTVDSIDCTCPDQKTCAGTKSVTVVAEIRDLPNAPDFMHKYALVPTTKAPNPATKKLAGGDDKPPPDAETALAFPIDVEKPNKQNQFAFKDPTKKDQNVFVATAVDTIKCSPGTYPLRYMIARRTATNDGKIASGNEFRGPAAYYDVTVTLMGGEKDCELVVTSIAAWYLEYVPRPFVRAADQAKCKNAVDELPEIKFSATGKTHNIAKLIQDDDKEVDKPFQPIKDCKLPPELEEPDSTGQR